jgi:hypothetical protein
MIYLISPAYMQALFFGGAKVRLEMRIKSLQ